jgi:hypothetical protein
MFNFATDVRSSLLLAAPILVSGALVALPFTESAGVEVVEDVVPEAEREEPVIGTSGSEVSGEGRERRFTYQNLRTPY